MQTFLEQLNLGKAPRPNTVKPIDMEALNALRKPVVEAVNKAVLEEREVLEKDMRPRLQAQLDELDKLRGKQVKQLELALDTSNQTQHFKDSKRNRDMKRIEDIFNSYQHWVEDTMQTEPVPYIQIIAVIARAED